MKFEKELCELINKLPNAKARILYLENLLKKEKDNKKRDILKKLLSNAEKELEAESKKEAQKRAPALEDIVKPSIMPVDAGPSQGIDEDYVRPTVQTAPAPVASTVTRPAVIEKEEYIEKSEYKQGKVESYTPESKADYLGKLEGEMLFKAKEESVAVNPTKPLEDYIPEKESEEYKRMEQFKQISADVKKKDEELEEYMRKKRAGMI